MYNIAKSGCSQACSKLRQNLFMSKAFTEETESDDDDAPALPALPVGSNCERSESGYRVSVSERARLEACQASRVTF